MCGFPFHTVSAAASGGLLGKGAGAGWLKGITASDTDMVFAYVCEELGLDPLEVTQCGGESNVLAERACEAGQE